MRLVGILIGGVVLASMMPDTGAQEVTIAQLRSFLQEQHRSKQSDTATANRLSSAWLSEQLTGTAISGMISEFRPGRETTEQLRLLAEGSSLATSAAKGSSTAAVPTPDQQSEMLAASAAYAQTALQSLPDFLALRVTRRFDNRPVASDAKHSKVTMQMHWVGESKNGITYRHGAEVAEDSAPVHRNSAELDKPSGLVSMGEFGPILSVVFSDVKRGSIAWVRWESDPNRGDLAVFHFTVPRSASHYLVDFCCYASAEDEPKELSFRDHPAYHGEMILDPNSGSVLRIGIEADLETSAPILTSQLVVQYDEVEIGGRPYICPVRSVAMTAVHDSKLERINGVGIERHLNETRYVDYHKFGSTSRVVANP